MLTYMIAWAYQTKALLVFDMKNTAVLPKRFRMVDANQNIGNIGSEGFADLRIAGSAQFSAASLPKILETLHTKQLTIIDLRQEAHGFLNNDAISWYGPANAENKNKTNEQIKKTEKKLLTQLAKQNQVKVYSIIKKTNNERIEEAESTLVSIHRIYSEAKLAKKHKLSYFRIYAQDFHPPAPEQVDKFIQIVKKLPMSEWIYFHCRAGVGRTTTFMVMYDMMQNAKKVSFEDILARQKVLGGKDLVTMPDKNDYKYPYSVKRLEFIRQFYQYAHANNDNFATSWTAYLERN